MSADRTTGTALPDRKATVRRAIRDRLLDGPLSARQLSAAVGIPEKEVYAHLSHVERSAAREGLRLAVTPAQCRRCGFSFRKRDRLTKPGRCPVCRGEAVAEPLYVLERRDS